MDAVLDHKVVDGIVGKSTEELLKYKFRASTGKRDYSNRKRLYKIAFCGTKISDVPDPVNIKYDIPSKLPLSRELNRFDVMLLKLLCKIVKYPGQEFLIKDIGKLLTVAYPREKMFKVNNFSMGQSVGQSLNSLELTNKFTKNNQRMIRLSPSVINHRKNKVEKGSV